MPWLKALPTWLALNAGNFSSPTALSDPITGQPYTGGELNVGDYTDVNNDEAKSMQNTANGILWEGRYRFVQVDSSATAANVKTGTVGYLKNGSTLASVVIATAGSGQTNGTFVVAANAGVGGGSGAAINVTIAGGVITSVSVNNPGYGYVTPPTFTIAEGGTPGTVTAQLSTSVNLVTSADQAASFGSGAVRPVVFLNSITPGNYGFVQELGVATVLGKSSASGSAGDYVNAVLTDAGVVTTTAASGSPIGSTIGRAIDTPTASNLFKCLLTGPVVQG